MLKSLAVLTRLQPGLFLSVCASVTTRVKTKRRDAFASFFAPPNRVRYILARKVQWADLELAITSISLAWKTEGWNSYYSNEI